VRAGTGALGTCGERAPCAAAKSGLIHEARIRCARMRVRLGLLSTAAISGAILGARGTDAPFEVVAVSSRDEARARAYAEANGVPRAYGSYDELLADPGVDAVYIALPNALHHAWTMRALGAGKHVLCEKPYTRRPEEVEEVWHEAARRGLVLTEGYMWRHGAQTRLLRELLPRVGDLHALHVTFTARLTRPDDPRWVRELGGGALLDVGCYCVSAVRLVVGREPDALEGRAFPHGEVDGRFTGSLFFGDMTATFACSLVSPLVQTIEVVGADGVLRVPAAFSRPPGIVVLDGEEHHVDPGNYYRDELEDFCAAIRGERSVLIGREEMLGQARVLAALLASASSRG
jgi:D-xylose 1-dehydrogenase (NADP+, D-xylono-1,5-lactone-forming)